MPNNKPSETKYLGSIVRGTEFSPENIVGIAFATEPSLEKNSLAELYFTQRGMSESKQKDSQPFYKELKRMVCPFEPHSLADGIRNNSVEDMRKHFAANPEYKKMGDSKDSILILYMYNGAKK